VRQEGGYLFVALAGADDDGFELDGIAIAGESMAAGSRA
jgi:hypothetical protein